MKKTRKATTRPSRGGARSCRAVRGPGRPGGARTRRAPCPRGRPGPRTPPPPAAPRATPEPAAGGEALATSMPSRPRLSGTTAPMAHAVPRPSDAGERERGDAVGGQQAGGHGARAEGGGRSARSRIRISRRPAAARSGPSPAGDRRLVERERVEDPAQRARGRGPAGRRCPGPPRSTRAPPREQVRRRARPPSDRPRSQPRRVARPAPSSTMRVSSVVSASSSRTVSTPRLGARLASG